MRILFSIILSFRFCFASAQTTPLSFTQLSGDFMAPGRGAQNWGLHPWNDITQPTIPAGNTVAKNYYTRFNLLDIVSNTGVYTWTNFDNYVNQAIDAGAMYTVGFMALCDGCGAGGFIPTYIQTDMTNEGKPGPSIGGVIYPNYQSTAWKNDYCAFLRQVANHIATTSRNGHSYTSAFYCFDFRYFMNFGEGGDPIASVGSGGTYPVAAQVTTAYLMSMTDSMAAIFPNVQLTVPFQYITPNGNAYTLSAGNTDQQAAYYLLTKTNNVGFIGWRRDNIGDSGYNAVIYNTTGTFSGNGFKNLMLDRWKLAPIGGEPSSSLGGVTTTSGCSSTNLYCDLHNENISFHYSYFGNGNAPGGISNASGASWTSLQTNWRAGSAEQGYHLYLTGGSTTTTPFSGGAFQVILNWHNSGLAPVYENWNVTIEIRSGTTTVVKTLTSSFNPRLYLPSGSDNVITDNFTLSGVAAGVYNVYLVVRDPNGFKQPLPLAITGRQADGSYLLRSSMTVGSASGPVANAGNTQTITLPTSSVTLDGSASTGAITSYLWTQISGPNTASIATPTTITTNVTGLIGGAYVFQLSVNAGASTSQVTINVNGAPPSIFSVFGNTIPAGPAANDAQVELGMKFRASINGVVTAIRFYKFANMTGTHTGELYSYPAGVRLAQVVFAGETASGWQTMNLSSPVAVAANTTYVVAYFNALGTYYANSTGFNSAVVNAPLTGLANGTDGPNGVFTYSSVPIYPVSNFQASNYYVDVVFVPSNISIVFGTGSGAVVVNGALLNPLDTAFIATQTGVYTSLTIKDAKGIVVLPQSGRPTFTTQSTFCRWVGVQISGISFVSAGGSTAVDATCGRIDSSQITNMYFEGWGGPVWNAAGGYPYTYGNDTTYKWLRNRFDSLKFYHCGKPFQAAFGLSPITTDIMRRDTFRRMVIEATTSTVNEGVCFTGVCYGCLWENNRYTSITGRGASGDDGMLYTAGWWVVRNNYQYGAPCYIMRNFPMMELNDTGTTQFYNNARFGSLQYGMGNMQVNMADTIAGQRRCNGGLFYNNTMGNAINDTFGYWSTMFNMGQIAPNAHYYVSNNFGFNIGNNTQRQAANGQPNNAKPPMAVNLGGWNTIGTDTSNNQYYNYATIAKLDSATTLFSNSLGSFPAFYLSGNSPGRLLLGGLTSPLTSADFLGNTYRVPPDLGYIQLINGGVPAAPNYIPGLHKGWRKSINVR